MARTYNQQNANGSWSQVTQNDDGSYTQVPIPTSGYAAANIPGAAPGGTSFDPGAATAAETQANDSARWAYQNALIQGASDRLAFDRATQAWTQTMQTSQLTGTYNGQPTLAAQGQNNTDALGYLGLLKGMTGPANAFDYAKALTGTPGGLADIVRAAGGAYQMPQTGGGNGQPIAPLSIQSMINDVNRYSPQGGGAAPAGGVLGATGPAGTYNTGGGVKTVAQMYQELKNAGWGGNNPNDAGAISAQYAQTTGKPVTPNQASQQGQAPAGVAGQGPAGAAGLASAAAQASLGGAAPTSSYVPSYGTLGAPNTWSPQAIAAMSPSQLQLLYGASGQQGYAAQDIPALYGASLRGYGGPSAGSLGF